MFLRAIRNFSHKPATRIDFIEKKGLLLENNQMNNVFRMGVIGFFAVPSLMLYRLVAKYGTMGWFNFTFSSGLLYGCLSLSRTFYSTTKYIVKSIHLLDDGENVEIETFGFKSTKYMVKIEDIINPEENLQTRMKIQYFSSWIIETTKGLTFYVMPDSESYHVDVLKEIMKGQKIDVSDQIDAKKSGTIIDI